MTTGCEEKVDICGVYEGAVRWSCRVDTNFGGLVGSERSGDNSEFDGVVRGRNWRMYPSALRLLLVATSDPP